MMIGASFISRTIICIEINRDGVFLTDCTRKTIINKTIIMIISHYTKTFVPNFEPIGNFLRPLNVTHRQITTDTSTKTFSNPNVEPH